MNGLILSAGKGTRIRPLSDEVPKSLIPTLDVTNLARAASSMAAAGVTKLFVNVHAHTDAIKAETQRLSAVGIDIEHSMEPKEPLGTAGAIRHLSERLDGPILLFNGDVICDPALEELIEVHSRSGARITLLLAPDDSRTDVFVEEGWVTSFSQGQERTGAGWLYSGICILEPEAVELIPEGTSSLFDAVFRKTIELEAGVATVQLNGYWRDVGTVEAHMRANLDCLAGAFDDTSTRTRLGTQPSRNDATAYIGQDAISHDVELRHAVIGRGAQVAAGSRLERCVVWPGTILKRGNYKDMVITQKHKVKV
ncbi:MAG: sugar phosphate nucleotidyltransferase [Actinomycetota bacterium]|nr:NDP-sugar synthase [Actinomycetota bacterium]